MNVLFIQFENYGEWFPIWNTNETDLLNAWNEIDGDKPQQGARISFSDNANFAIVNGGF